MKGTTDGTPMQRSNYENITVDADKNRNNPMKKTITQPSLDVYHHDSQIELFND